MKKVVFKNYKGEIIDVDPVTQQVYFDFKSYIALALLCTIPMVISGLFQANVSFAGVSLIIVTSILVETYKYIKIYL